ncbi:LysM peptidoglycan-binding domain-containing protein [Glutamicibacter sp.]|uniref:LysM peptidoglycan-binding domain-containing protein n=1 Tax=Glutamicibacter sp. TaxID=1931995 RepID=UPI0028BE9417|nr:LysM peptidoglycan-binding domain-containing protein [Glutamicibacter sp.]
MAHATLDSNRTAEPLKIRINRRGWAVLVGIPVFVLTIAAAFFVSMMTSSAQASSTLPQGVQTIGITVVPGDSLWSLAGEYASGHDVNSAVEHIAELNDLRTSEIRVGDTLEIPVLSN